MAGRNQNPYPSTHTQDPSQEWLGYRETQTQTQAPHNSRNPSVDTRALRQPSALQVTRPNEIRSPGVRLHPKACAALGLEAKPLQTPVPRTCMHALGTRYAGSPVNPKGFAQRRGRAQAPGHSLLA